MREKSLGRFDVYCSIVCAILFADVIVSNTTIGAPVITWWIIIGTIFYIPNGLITAELTGAYPDKGGIYGWIHKAFGAKWAARTSWFYWINCALWMPSGFIWLSGAFTDSFFPGASYFIQVLISIVITWIVIALALLPMSDSKWIINLGGISKILIFGLIFISGVVYLFSKKLPANEISINTLKPTMDGLQYLPVILYCCCGMEIIAANAHEMKNPKHDLPKAVIMVVILTIVSNILASWGVLITVPLEDLDLVTGLSAVIRNAFASEIIVNSIMLILFFSVIIQMVTWALGGARGASEAAQSGELPNIFASESKKTGAPVGSLILTGCVSTVIIILYGLMANSASDLFFTLLAFSSIIFFMPYAIMFPAFIKLRKTDMSTERPFKAPAGILFATICEIILVMGMVLFVWVPGLPFDAMYSVPIIIGLMFTICVGEFIVNRQIKNNVDKISN